MARLVNIRDLSVRCGRCLEYQTLCGFSRQGEINVYTYECDNELCDSATSRTLVEVHAEIDDFARRDEGWAAEGG